MHNKSNNTSYTFIYTSIIAAASLIATSLLWRIPIILSGVLLILAVFMILLHKDLTDIYLFIIVGICGAFAETIGVWFGAWNYSLPGIAGIPCWLPLLWGLAALYIKRIVMKIDNYRKNK